MRKFSIGQIVILKSGGPSMTVHDYYSDNEADKRLTCSWFDTKGELQSGTFHEDTLEENEE